MGRDGGRLTMKFDFSEEQQPEGSAAAPQPDNGPLSDEDVQSVVTSLAQHAANFIDEELSPVRAAATAYFKGEPLGNEEKGRSQVVSTDVRDTVMGIMPSMMRVFHGPERPV